MSTNAERRGTLIEVSSVVISLLAMMVSIVAFVWGERRAAQAEQEQHATRVFLSEAPQYFAAVHDEARWVLMNTSRTQILDVWVEGQDGRSVKMWSVQPCSIYGLPPDFEPTLAHFKDAYARWSRTPQGLPDRSGEVMPEDDTDDSPWWMDARNCAT